MDNNGKIYRDRLKAIIASTGLSEAEWARQHGFSQSSINSWINGQRNCLYKNAKRLADACNCEVSYISTYKLPDTIDISPPEEIKKQFQNAKNSEVKLVTEIPRNKLFPVLGEAAAASVDTLSFPLADYAQDHAEELQYFPHGQPGDFSIQVAGTSMLPWYPPGTRLLLRGNVRIKNGERVVVIMEDGEVIFKIFVKADDQIALFSIEDNGRDYVFDAHNAREIKGIYKVIESFRDEAKLDEAMQQAGIHHRWEDKLAKLKEKGR